MKITHIDSYIIALTRQIYFRSKILHTNPIGVRKMISSKMSMHAAGTVESGACTMQLSSKTMLTHFQNFRVATTMPVLGCIEYYHLVHSMTSIFQIYEILWNKKTLSPTCLEFKHLTWLYEYDDENSNQISCKIILTDVRDMQFASALDFSRVNRNFALLAE